MVDPSLNFTFSPVSFSPHLTFCHDRFMLFSVSNRNGHWPTSLCSPNQKCLSLNPTRFYMERTGSFLPLKLFFCGCFDTRDKIEKSQHNEENWLLMTQVTEQTSTVCVMLWLLAFGWAKMLPQLLGVILKVLPVQLDVVKGGHIKQQMTDFVI